MQDTFEMAAARRVRVEDVRPGQFVVVLSELHEVWPEGPVDPVTGRAREPVLVECRSCADGDPLRVVAVCVPFVQVVDAAGTLRAVDVRLTRLAWVPEEYALEAFTRPRGAD